MAPPPSPAPAPGFRRAQWRMLLAVMGCYLFYYTGRQNIGFANQAVRQDLGLEPQEFGAIGAGMLLTYGAGQAVAGGLADRIGARVLVPLGAALSVALNWAASYAVDFPTLFAAWCLNGLAQSLGWAPGSRLLSQWWPAADRGLVFGLYNLAAGVSSILTFGLCIAVLHGSDDWRWLFRLPVLPLAAAAVVFPFVARDRPEDLGFPPLADDVAAPPGGTESAAGRFRAALTNTRFLVASTCLGLENVARYGLLLWVPAHYLGPNWKDDPRGLWVTLALPVGMALGAVVNGAVSDRLFGGNRCRPIALFLALGAGAAGGLSVVPRGDLGAGLGLLFLAGALVYGPQSAFWALCPDLLGRARAGTGVGVMNTFGYVFAAAGEVVIGGAVQAAGGDTAAAFPVVAGCCAAGAVLILFVRR